MITPLKTVLFPPATLKGLQQLLAPHGATLEPHPEDERYPHCLLHLPAEAQREREGYRLRNDYYKITLPDGFIMFQTLDRQGWSTIRFLIEDDEKQADA